MMKSRAYQLLVQMKRNSNSAHKNRLTYVLADDTDQHVQFLMGSSFCGVVIVLNVITF